MRYRQLGDSELQVSEISLGSWLTYSGGVGREQTEACTRAAFDAGINFFDTANVYGRGAAEEAWGEILAGHDRDSYVLATKLYFPMSDVDRGLSAEQIHKQIDASLKRLRTDFVDLYQCHRYDTETPLEETVQALSDVDPGRQGALLGRLGVDRRADRGRRRDRPRAGAGEAGLQPAAVLAAVAADRGKRRAAGVRGERDLPDRVVTARPGRADRQVPAGRAAARGHARGERGDGRLHLGLLPRRRARGGAAAGADRRPGRPVPRAARARLDPAPANVASAIIGATRPEQVSENAAAAATELGDDALEAIDEALGNAARLGVE